MATKRTATISDSASDLTSSLISNVNVNNRHDERKRAQTKRRLPQYIKTEHGSRSHKNHMKSASISSHDSHTSCDSTNTSKITSLTLSSAQSEKFRQYIENEYNVLERSEACHCYYIEDPVEYIQAREQLEQATDGTFFIRRAEEKERISNIEYFLDFICHKKIGEIPICCDDARRTFWFLSGYGHGSEVQRVYSGIDLIIQDKQKNIFYELQYPFQICLYRPIDSTIAMCIPLPDEVRAKSGQNTILHELASQGLTQYFNELIRISKTDGHSLQKKCKFIINKINGRNKQGQTPLILAIQSKKYQFVELLLDNNANINITDTQGCTPLHYACRQANPKLLKKLIDRHADPYYFNRKQTTDDTYQSNLSAFHYLAMAKDATVKNIKRCVMYLLECGCPLMPLTNEGKSPFDIAQMYNNNVYECVKIFCDRHQFIDLSPIEVSSRNDAKTILNDLICPNMFGKIRLRLKQYDNKNCFKSNGLFFLYQIKKTRNSHNQEFGLCVYYNEQIFIYPISQKHTSCVSIDSLNSSQKIVYNYSLITDTPKDDQAQVILFRSCEELVYNHTKYQGILPTKLKDIILKQNDEILTTKATALLLPNFQLNSLTDVEETDDEDDDNLTDIHVRSIDHFNLYQIHSIKLINENNRRFIWLAKVRLDSTKSFPIIIKDYLPDTDIDLYKQYRLNEFNNISQYQGNLAHNDFPYEYNSRTYLEYNHESKLLLKELKNHPLIVHTFICNHNLKRDLRLFMEYLPYGDLHTYLNKIKSDTLEPLINAYHWIYQLAQVMGYLSNKKIVHHDLATRNILLKNEQHIILSDFGLSRLEGVIQEGKDRIVPFRWAAPECFERNQKISSFSDVWSFGIVIWEIYSFGAIPYEADTNNNSQELVRLLKRFLIEQGRRLSQPDHCSESMYDLMCRCWNGTPSKRPRFVDIIHDFNGTNIMKDCIVPFTCDERKVWKKAKEEYLRIFQPYQKIPSNDDNGYVMVEDNENDDQDNIVTVL